MKTKSKVEMIANRACSAIAFPGHPLVMSVNCDVKRDSKDSPATKAKCNNSGILHLFVHFVEPASVDVQEAFGSENLGIGINKWIVQHAPATMCVKSARILRLPGAGHSPRIGYNSGSSRYIILYFFDQLFGGFGP